MLCWLLATGLFYWVGLHTQGTYDTFRDAWFAEAISQGLEFPAVGPAIYRTFHLGPLWFYLAAALAPLVGALHAVVLLSSACIAAAFPLAWALGGALGDRRLGLCFACLLAAPGWWLLQVGFLTHTAAVVAALVLVALLAVRYAQRPTWWRALAAGGAVALALHAHPTTLLPAAAAVAAALLTVRAEGGRIASAAVALVLPVLASLLPYLLSDTLASDLGAAQAYAASLAERSVDWTRVPRLPLAALAGGGWLVARMWLGTSELQAWLYASVPWLLVAGMAAAALWHRSLAPARRRMLVGLLAVLVLQLVLLAVVRPETPPWMATTPWPLLGAIAALLLPPADAWRGSGWQGILVAASGVPLTFAALVAVTQLDEWLRVPTFAEGSPGLMSITSRPVGVTILHVVDHEIGQLEPLMLRDCEPLRVHGVLATVTDRMLGMNWLAPCGGADHVRLGGDAPDARAAFAVWDGPLAEACGTSPARLRRADAITDFTAHGEGAGVPLGDARAYPPRTVRPAVRRVRRSFDGDQPLLYVGNLLPGYVPMQIRSVRAEGIAADELSRTTQHGVFRCAACQPGAPVNWQVELDADPAATDIVSFACPAGE